MPNTGKYQHKQAGVAYISISSPDELDGISFEYKNGELEMSRENLICSADEALSAAKELSEPCKINSQRHFSGQSENSSQSDNLFTYNLIKPTAETALLPQTKTEKLRCAELKMQS
jgi:hypothetical protein